VPGVCRDLLHPETLIRHAVIVSSVIGEPPAIT